MIPCTYPHLDEIAAILIRAIARIEAATSENNENNEGESENPLDFSQHVSVSVTPE